MSTIRHCASLRLALIGMMALVAGILVSYQDREASVLWVVVPLILLAINLTAAILVNRSFRRQGGLLVFHVCLLGVVGLVAWGQLTGLKARVEITEGQVFDASAIMVLKQGVWHPLDRLAAIEFQQGPFEVAYQPHLIRGETRSRVRTSIDGQRVDVTFGDNEPLQVQGYRFYTTSNKGLAVLLTWLGNDGSRQTGTLHFPSYPLKDWNQVVNWRTPAGSELMFTLNHRDPVPEDRAWVFDNRWRARSLTMKGPDNSEVALTPGTSIDVAGGQVRLEDIRLWMGYEIFYDPTLPWLFATALVGVLGMGWYFWGKLGPRPLPRRAHQPVKGDGSTVRI